MPVLSRLREEKKPMRTIPKQKAEQQRDAFNSLEQAEDIKITLESILFVWLVWCRAWSSRRFVVSIEY